jgi:hypothetical protein
MAAESKLEAARRRGDLAAVIGAMREEQGAQQSTPTSNREQVDIVDGSIRLAAHLTGKGKTGAERRKVLSGVQVGKTITAQGATKTVLTRAEKIDRVKAWAAPMTEEQRTEYMIGEQYGSLSDNAQDVIAEAFGQIEERELEDSLGVANIDFDAPTPDVDAIVGDEDDGDAELDGLFDTDYEGLFEKAGWETEQT